MRRIIFLSVLAVGVYGSLSGQSLRDTIGKTGNYYDRVTRPVYTIKPSVDIPLLVGGAAWDLYGFSQISKKDGTSQAELAGLTRDKVG